MKRSEGHRERRSGPSAMRGRTGRKENCDRTAETGVAICEKRVERFSTSMFENLESRVSRAERKIIKKKNKTGNCEIVHDP